MQAAAHILGLQVHVLHASTKRDLDTVFAALAQLRVGGFVIGADAFFNSRRDLIVALAVRHSVSTIYSWREAVTKPALWRADRAAWNVAKAARCCHSFPRLCRNCALSVL